MQTFDYTISQTNEYALDGYLSQNYTEDELLFFDIETTGFIAKNTTLYLIGVLWYKNHTPFIRQWFNNDGVSEKEIILSFIEFCKQFKYLVHFNGLGFDLPYLKQKSDILGISFELNNIMPQIDIYKEIRPYKNIFALDNMKQVSIEQFLNLSRDDKYSGKELINVYQRYIAKPDSSLKHLLLLHNHDDLLGMTQISQILNYKCFFDNLIINDIELTATEDQLMIRFQFEKSPSLPSRLSITKNGVHLNAIDQKGTLYIPITQDTFKHYFDDYKNYYYLPLEDMCIHKSIATYVDPHNRTKATKENCYVKKNSSFIPCYSDNEYETFKQNLKDKQGYQELDALLTNSIDAQCEYTKKALHIFL